MKILLQDKNHFGPAPNRLMPDAWNMSTKMAWIKKGYEDANSKKLSRTAQKVEMDLR